MLRDVVFDSVWTDHDPITYQTVPAQFDRKEFEALKHRSYCLPGWDVSTGKPTRERLAALGLQDVAEVLAAKIP